MALLPLVPSELLPHSAPMILMDAIVAMHVEDATSILTLCDDTPFIAGGQVETVLTIELMAQTISCWSGHKRRLAGRPIELGFILGTRKLTFHRPMLFVGDRLVTRIERIWAERQLGTFRCTTHCGGVRVADAELKVYEGELPQIADTDDEEHA